MQLELPLPQLLGEDVARSLGRTGDIDQDVGPAVLRRDGVRDPRGGPRLGEVGLDHQRTRGHLVGDPVE